MIGLVLNLLGCGPIGLVFLILYWVKINGYSKRLASLEGDDEEGDRPARRRNSARDLEDDEEDRPRRKKPRREDDEDF